MTHQYVAVGINEYGESTAAKRLEAFIARKNGKTFHDSEGPLLSHMWSKRVLFDGGMVDFEIAGINKDDTKGTVDTLMDTFDTRSIKRPVEKKDVEARINDLFVLLTEKDFDISLVDIPAGIYAIG